MHHCDHRCPVAIRRCGIRYHKDAYDKDIFPSNFIQLCHIFAIEYMNPEYLHDLSYKVYIDIITVKFFLTDYHAKPCLKYQTTILLLCQKIRNKMHNDF